MPELPEVETSRRGIEPHILEQKIDKIIIRQKQLRWPIPARLKSELPGHRVTQVKRRGKYLLLESTAGTLIIHLGMSGSLHIVNASTSPQKHDHFDMLFSHGKILRLRDPRRFGAVLWTKKNPLQHKLIKDLGPEPLNDDFNADYLYRISRNRKTPVKSFIMNSQVVVGVGNIYASESLFLARINPKRAAGKISRQKYQKLAESIQIVLSLAIQQGGSSLRDFTHHDGKPGYFQQTLNVYGRKGLPCPVCLNPVRQIIQNQRSSFYCPKCQH